MFINLYSQFFKWVYAQKNKGFQVGTCLLTGTHQNFKKNTYTIILPVFYVFRGVVKNA